MYTEFKDQTTPAWDGFHGTQWRYEINVREFIQDNYLPYDGDESFLAGPTEATNTLWADLQALQLQERAKGGVLDMETEVVSGPMAPAISARPTRTWRRLWVCRPTSP